ncbi:MAG TPA: sensor domain-containing protein [Streptosporangiaceae bacterium]|jgi:signal transduction histidine kinase|nr:sensor domain-containing protein [Streptosporangiaceae bacterium]
MESAAASRPAALAALSAFVRRVFGPVVSARTWRAVAYLVVSLPLGAAGGLVLMMGLPVAVGLLAVALTGIPALILVLALIDLVCRLDRACTAALAGVQVPAPPPEPLTNGAWWRPRWRSLLGPQRWLQAAGVIALLPVQLVGGLVVLVFWIGGAGLAVLPAYNGPAGGIQIRSKPVHGAPALTALVIAGVLLLLAAPWVTRGAASVLASWTRVVLGPGLGFSRRALTDRIGQLEHSRAEVIDAGEAERRRIERDLHDGAQQRLVAMTMELARAQARFDAADPAAARVLVDQAHSQAMAALAELRNLVRGVHPPVLSDRGLDAALSALAALCPVPVTVDADLATRPAPAVEAIAYFVVAEALTNVAKHARASRVDVGVRGDGRTVSVTVRDDGIGNADPSGTGLAGLAARVAAVDGRLTIDSPPGGPTLITAELPCAS